MGMYKIIIIIDILIIQIDSNQKSKNSKKIHSALKKDNVVDSKKKGNNISN